MKNSRTIMIKRRNFIGTGRTPQTGERLEQDRGLTIVLGKVVAGSKRVPFRPNGLRDWERIFPLALVGKPFRFRKGDLVFSGKGERALKSRTNKGNPFRNFFLSENRENLKNRYRRHCGFKWLNVTLMSKQDFGDRGTV